MSSGIKHEIDEKLKLISILREAIQQDSDLRQKYQIGEKFRFVKDRLQSMLTTLEESVPAEALVSGKDLFTQTIADDETSVYVYLYNAQGLQFNTWQNLVTSKVFYEYSVNRPIYSEKEHIESLLRTKTNKAQHAYLTVVVKKDAIIKSMDEALKDVAGNSVIKVKEGSLRFEKLIGFTHQDIEYMIDKSGNLIKK